MGQGSLLSNWFGRGPPLGIALRRWQFLVYTGFSSWEKDVAVTISISIKTRLHTCRVGLTKRCPVLMEPVIGHLQPHSKSKWLTGQMRAKLLRRNVCLESLILCHFVMTVSSRMSFIQSRIN